MWSRSNRPHRRLGLGTENRGCGWGEHHGDSREQDIVRRVYEEVVNNHNVDLPSSYFSTNYVTLWPQILERPSSSRAQ
jgi:hypothetical protein